MIEILIPTFNRAEELLKNLRLLLNRIREENLEGHFQILISDNHSTDGTYDKTTDIIEAMPIDIEVFRQQENIGLEKNAIFLLSKARADFIMYIGDDDFLPEGYLSYVVQKVSEDTSIGAVIPGISALYDDGEIRPGRTASFGNKKFYPSFKTVCELSHFGHQLSGVLFRRDHLLENYTRDESLRNIYPFIYFLGFNNLKYTSYYAPKYNVLVSQDNSKDWNYDASGLLTEIFRNYSILFPSSPVKRFWCNISFMRKQTWRLRIGTNIKVAWRSFFHLFRSSDVDLLTKMALLFIYPLLYSRLVMGSAKRTLRGLFATL